MRFSRLLATVDGISQKGLTRTLRQLECDGFLTCKVYAEVLPRVEYELTKLRDTLLEKDRSAHPMGGHRTGCLRGRAGKV